MNVVLDTNVLVSALLTRNGKSAAIVSMLSDRLIIARYNYQILAEYINVLHRPKLDIPQLDADAVIEQIKWFGIPVVALPCDKAMIDESDRPFYETAKTANAYLVTGNAKHFPDEPFIVSPSKFLELFEARK
jgi:putative PIN family toxin of toxin-antitoxin system